MTLSSVRVREGAVRRDQSVAVALILLLALVFAPAIGLHVAASTKRAGYTLRLLQAGADPLAQDSFGKTFQAYQWLGHEAALPAERRQERSAVREWLKEHRIAVEDAEAH